MISDFHETMDWRRIRPPARQRNAGSHGWVLQVLKKVVDANPAAYLDEMQRELREVYKISLHISTICRYVHAPAPRGLGYSLLMLEHRAVEKNYTERMRFLDTMRSGAFPVEQMIFVDECHKSE